jgi:membrane protease YdiL (CAAX protease family)
MQAEPVLEATGRARLIAPLRHTIVLLGILLALTLYGFYAQTRQQSQPGNQNLAEHRAVLPLYLSLIVSEWALFYFVWIGLRRGGTPLRDVIAGRWNTPQAVLLDVAIALLFWGAWCGLEIPLDKVLGPSTARSISALLPRSALEIFLWVVLSVSAGISEELVFRGYLQKQFHALTGMASVGVVLQALVFGVSHSYQGLKAMIIIAILGCLYGWLALWRKSLRPGMVAHAWTDIFSGIISNLR